MGINFIDKDTEGALLETKGLLRRVRTAAGAARFGVPINSVIPAGGKPGGRAPRPTATPTHVSTRVNAPGGGSSTKPMKGIDKDLDDAVTKGRISIRRAREIQKRRNEGTDATARRRVPERYQRWFNSPEYSELVSDMEKASTTLGEGWSVEQVMNPMATRRLASGNAAHIAKDVDDPSKWAVWETTPDADEVDVVQGLTRAEAIAAAKKKK